MARLCQDARCQLESVSAQLEWVGLGREWVGLGRHHLLFDEWEFGLAVARKTRGRKGIYFSGVSVDRERRCHLRSQLGKHRHILSWPSCRDAARETPTQIITHRRWATTGQRRSAARSQRARSGARARAVAGRSDITARSVIAASKVRSVRVSGWCEL